MESKIVEKHATKKAGLRPVTVYLGHSGTPHDCERVDVLPPACGPYKARKIAVHLDSDGLSISDLSTGGGEPKTVLVVKYDDLPE